MIGIVNTARLNVRDRPSSQGRKLGIVKQNAVLPVLGKRDGWIEITYQQHPGFVSGEYLNLIESVPKQTGQVTASRLNIRSRPEAQAPVLGTLVRDAVIEIEGVHGDWLEIVFNQQAGYVASAYIEQRLASPDTKARVNTSALNVRANPNGSASLLGQLPQGQIVSVTAQLNGWSEILFGQGRGYVASKYLSPIADDNATSEPSAAIVRADDKTKLAVRAAWQSFGPSLNELATENSLDVATVVAVICVESGGRGFEPSNQDRMIIRFENHKFWKYWGKTNADIFHAHFQYASGQVWKGHKWRPSRHDDWRGFHGNQAKEWQVLDFARSLDDSAALMSISMGAPQIMGFNFASMAYPSVQAMFEAFNTDMNAQIDGMFSFMSAAMLDSLRRLDFERFAGYYNGSGQKAFYGGAIRRHYQAFKQLNL
ncbi:N-acetylmuramidase domain-containing protein [Corallincola platygyrae]|uniref:N-acetylmuramidase domain-containing protein n=1 Tax=Corallincola platygyrae TaxID=1193278 RepID=A0ABW4XJM5_9GAMM